MLFNCFKFLRMPFTVCKHILVLNRTVLESASYVKRPYSELKMTRTADQADRDLTLSPFRKNEGVCSLALVESACLKLGNVDR